MSRVFKDLLASRWESGNFLCVGLDPDFDKIPDAARQRGTRETLVAFNRAIVDATKDLVCAFKPNPAFFEVHGDEGWNALRETIQYINDVAPEVPVILDGKRADIGNTNEAYARSAFDHLHADAVTVNPYPGREALQPFLDRKDKGIFVWCKASNGGSAEFQDLEVNGEKLYLTVARHVVNDWNANENCGLVVGATYPEELAAARALARELPILVPAIGAQGGDLEKTIQAAKTTHGGMIISASRTILFASSGDDYAEAARAKAQELSDSIKKAL